jgi:hypothetical protein
MGTIAKGEPSGRVRFGPFRGTGRLAQDRRDAPASNRARVGLCRHLYCFEHLLFLESL